MRQKFFGGKSWYSPPPPSNPWAFSCYQKFSETEQKGSPTKFFGTLRQKTSGGKYWYPPTPLIHKLYRYRNSSETQHRRVPLWIFSALWDKKFSTENLDTPAPPPLIHKLFRYQNFSETRHRRVPLWNFSALWEKNFSTENLDTPPSLLSINFFATGKFLKHSAEGFLCEYFSVLRDDKFSIEKRDIPLFGTKFLDPWNFLKHRRVPRRNFSALWDRKFSTENLDTRPFPLIHKLFRYTKFLKNSAEGFLCEYFSVLWDDKFSIENRDIPLFGTKFLDPWNFLKHRRVPRRIFSALWDKKFSTENLDTPFLLLLRLRMTSLVHLSSERKLGEQRCSRPCRGSKPFSTVSGHSVGPNVPNYSRNPVFLDTLVCAQNMTFFRLAETP